MLTASDFESYNELAEYVDEHFTLEAIELKENIDDMRRFLELYREYQRQQPERWSVWEKSVQELYTEAKSLAFWVCEELASVEY